MKKILTSIIILSFAVLSIVVAALLFSRSLVAFGILLAVGVIALAAGAFDLIRRLRGDKAKHLYPNARGYQEDEPQKELPDYAVKSYMLSVPEQRFFVFLKKLLSSEYFDVYPQVVLASIIEKLTQTSFRNDLFRMVDFCIVDASSTEPLLLIELSDASHKRSDRVERDNKVKAICERAGINIVFFLKEEAEDEKYVAGVLRKYLR